MDEEKKSLELNGTLKLVDLLGGIKLVENGYIL